MSNLTRDAMRQYQRERRTASSHAQPYRINLIAKVDKAIKGCDFAAMPDLIKQVEAIDPHSRLIKLMKEVIG